MIFNLSFYNQFFDIFYDFFMKFANVCLFLHIFYNFIFEIKCLLLKFYKKHFIGNVKNV